MGTTFLGLMFFCFMREAFPMAVHSAGDPDCIRMIHHSLEMANYQTQDVELKGISIKFGERVLCTATFSNQGQRCYLQLSNVKYSNNHKNRLICDSPCASGRCELSDLLFSRSDDDIPRGALHAKRFSDEDFDSGSDESSARRRHNSDGSGELYGPEEDRDSVEKLSGELIPDLFRKHGQYRSVGSVHSYKRRAKRKRRHRISKRRRRALRRARKLRRRNLKRNWNRMFNNLHG